MPVSVATEPAVADDARESHALAFRIAFAAAVGLTLGELLGWDFPFASHARCSTLVRAWAHERQAGRCLCGFDGGSLCLRRVTRSNFRQSPVRPAARRFSSELPFVLVARTQPSGGCGGGVPHHHGRNSATCKRIHVGSLRVHSFADCRQCACGPSGLCGTRIFPNARASASPCCCATGRARPNRSGACKCRRVDEFVLYFMLTVSPVSMVLVLTVISILRQPADLGGGTAFGLILGNLVRWPRRDRSLSSCHAISCPNLSFACRLIRRGLFSAAKSCAGPSSHRFIPLAS